MENKILILICFVLIAWLFYSQSNLKESMADISPDITAAIKQIYLADVEAIRNLSNVATQLQAGGLTIPGDLRITGNVYLGNKDKNQWILHTPPDDRGLFAINRVQRDGNANWSNGFQLLTSADGTQNLGGNYNLIPKGTIVAWTGATPPAGWALCDGQNGTPDLRGRFIRMASADLPQEDGATGGFAPYVVGRKSKPGAVDASIVGNGRGDSNSWIFKMNIGEFGGTDHQVLHPNEMPPHTHPYVDAYWSEHWGNDKSFGNGLIGANGTDGDNAPYTVDRNTAPAGAGWGHNNMPPYYVLAYIMKL